MSIYVERKTVVEALSSVKWFHHQHGFTRDAELITAVEDALGENREDRLHLPRELCERLVEKVTKSHEIRKTALDRAVLAALQEALQEFNLSSGPVV